MTNIQIILAVIGFLISISGWCTFLYNHFTYKPKIVGKVYQVVKGQFTHLENGTHVPYTSFLVYLYLTNKGRDPIHFEDIKLRIQSDGHFYDAKRVYGVEKVNFTMSDPSGKPMDISNFNKSLIYTQDKPIEYGKTFSGFALFAGDSDLFMHDQYAYEVTILDVFGNEHTIYTRSKDLGSIDRLKELTGFNL